MSSSLDTWIDLREIAELVHKLMPPEMTSRVLHQDYQVTGKQSLYPDVPPEWDVVRPQEGGADNDEPMLNLDDLTAPQPTIAVMEESAQIEAMNLRSRSRALEILAEIRRLGGQFSGEEGAEVKESEFQGPKALEISAPVALDLPGHSDPTPFIARGTTHERLQSYAAWVRELTKCSQLLIADSQGYPLLADAEQDMSLVSSGLKLMAVLDPVRRKMQAEGAKSGVYLPLDRDKWLGVLDCEAGATQVCLCLVTHAPLSSEAAAELTEVLIKTLAD